MKEKKLSDKKILVTLANKSFIEIEPICDECALRIIGLVYEVFTSAHFDMFRIEEHIYRLRISV